MMTVELAEHQREGVPLLHRLWGGKQAMPGVGSPTGRHHAGGARPHQRWTWLAVLAACTLLLLLAVWAVSPTGDGEGGSMMPAWVQPLFKAAQEKSTYGGSGVSSRFVEHSGSSVNCSQVLGVHKVALLFLTGATVPQDMLWRLWLESSAGLLPQQVVPRLRDAACGDVVEKWLLLLCACYPKRVAGQAAKVQPPWTYLYSLYVHPPPWGDSGYQGFPDGSLLKGHVIANRVHTERGRMSEVEAARLLLQAALQDPQNQRFVLVSGDAVPLYDPLTVYQQLMHEGRSRVTACKSAAAGAAPWQDALATPRLSQAHWRRSSPYFSLTRQHAELAAGDQEVYQSLSVHGDALADHYLPSLLSALGRENETACDSWGVAFTGDNSGSRGAPPKEYRPEDATPQLIQAARGACSKTATLAARDAHGMFLPFETVLTAPNRTEACRRLQAAPSQPLEHPLPPSCPLTALPFTGDAAPALLRLFAGTCAAADASPPAAMTKAEAEADRQLFLLRGRACALAKQQHLIF